MSTDKKISQLTSGAPAQAGDEYVVARSGANYKLTLTNIAASMPATTITSGNLTFSSTAQRITGDFSNATIANRLMFQTSTTNNNTIVEAISNGTGTVSAFTAYNNSDPTNAGFTQISGRSTESRLEAGIRGTGTYQPMTFYTGGSERVRIDTSGNVGIGTASPVAGYRLNVVNDSGNSQQLIRAGTNFNSTIAFGDQDSSTSGQLIYAHNGDYMAFNTNAAERMRIDSSGNVGIGGTAAAFSKLAIAGTLPTSSNLSVGVDVVGTIPSGTTSTFDGVLTRSVTAAASFTLTNLHNFRATQGTLGAGSAVTNQYGFVAESTLTGATNNYGFYSNIASGSNRWNFYAAGTAENYVANNLKIGGTAARATTAGTAQLVLFDGTAPAGTLANGVSFYSAAGEANVMDAAGNATLLSPHDSETNEWIFRSKHTPTGKVLKIDVEKMLRFINEHFGLDMVHEFTE